MFLLVSNGIWLYCTSNRPPPQEGNAGNAGKAGSLGDPAFLFVREVIIARPARWPVRRCAAGRSAAFAAGSALMPRVTRRLVSSISASMGFCRARPASVRQTMMRRRSVLQYSRTIRDFSSRRPIMPVTVEESRHRCWASWEGACSSSSHRLQQRVLDGRDIELLKLLFEAQKHGVLHVGQHEVDTFIQLHKKIPQYKRYHYHNGKLHNLSMQKIICTQRIR